MPKINKERALITAKHIVIYSHGVAVQKDDNGLFTDIAGAIPEVESILFDYYQVNESGDKIFVCPFSTQIKKLNQVINDIKIANPDAVIDLICHSQGTIVAAMAKPEGIRKTIFLSPVFDMSLQRTLDRYRAKVGTSINLDGISEIPSSNGLTKVIPKEYWQERLLIKPFYEYNQFAGKTEIIAIEANQDQLLPRVDLAELDPRIKVIALDGNHNFDYPNRSKLIETIKILLLS